MDFKRLYHENQRHHGNATLATMKIILRKSKWMDVDAILQSLFSHMKILSPRSLNPLQPWVSKEYISNVEETMVMQP